MELITIDEVIKLTHLSRGNLATLRFNRRGPKYYKPTQKTVLYDRDSVMKWIADCAVETFDDTEASGR